MKGKHLTMKHLPLDDRPVEKLLRHGPQRLSDAELIAVIIRSGSQAVTALSLAQQLLGRHDDADISSLAEDSVEELMTVAGIGPVKACQIQAAVELGTRAQSPKRRTRTAIRSPDDAMILLDAEMKLLPREELRALLLDVRSRMIKMVCLSQGGLASTVIYPRDLFREAVKANAASLILAHNHPSGDASPSQEDIATTKRLMEAGDMMGIRVVDHLIVATGGSVSLRRLGYL